MPKSSDPYRWKIIPEKEDALSELFSKNISDHSIRAYRDLCEGVGKTFEAVLSVPPNTDALDSLVSVWRRNIPVCSRLANEAFSCKAPKLALAQKSSTSKMKALGFSTSYASGEIRRQLRQKADNLQKKKPTDCTRLISSFKVEFGSTQIGQITWQAES